MKSPAEAGLLFCRLLQFGQPFLRREDVFPFTSWQPFSSLAVSLIQLIPSALLIADCKIGTNRLPLCYLPIAACLALAKAFVR